PRQQHNRKRRRAVMVAAAVSLVATASAHAADVAAPPAAAENPKWWTATFASDVRYFSWDSTRGFPTRASTSPGHGSEVYIPFVARLAGKPIDDFSIELLARGGWVRANQSSAGLSGSVETTTDTVASGSITYLGFTGVQPFLALSLNLPTGQSS